MDKNRATIFTQDAATGLGPPPAGNLAFPVFKNKDIDVEVYRPGDDDPQKPHNRDEIYIIVSGSGDFFDGEATLPVSTGTLIYVPAGVRHRFENYTNDFTVWVFFFGPVIGGEESKANR